MATSITSMVFQQTTSWSLAQANGFGNTTNSNNFTPSSGSFGNGTGAGNVTWVYLSQSTITASGNATFDWATGLTDPVGNAIVATKILGIYFELLTTTAASSVKFGDSTGTRPLPSWNVQVNNGGRLMWVDPATTTGIAVSSGTNDTTKITNNDASNVATYRMLACGQ